MMFFVLPYKRGSASARELARSLGGRRIKLRNSRYRPRSTHTVINWGNASDCAMQLWHNQAFESRWLNHPHFVGIAGNKLLAFRKMDEAGVTIPECTTDYEEARDWGLPVMARHVLRGNSGNGCVLHQPGEAEPGAPLYVQYIKKQDEYRVHVLRNRVIDTQRKMRRRAVPDDQVNWQVRSHSNGFVFGREGVQQDQYREDVAIQAVQALGLDFGAVDIIWNARREEYYVLEVNTAPGLEGTTLDIYTQAFQNL